MDIRAISTLTKPSSLGLDSMAKPIRLTDFARELATPDKSKSAWMNELREAKDKGRLTVVTRGGRKGGVLYTNAYYVQKYLKEEYKIQRTAHGY